MDTSAPDFKPRPGGVMYNQVLSNSGHAATLHGGGANPDYYDQSQNHGAVQAQQQHYLQGHQHGQQQSEEQACGRRRASSERAHTSIIQSMLY